MSALDSLRTDFYDALLDLTFNSRPIIQTLTSIAEENKSINSAPKVIVEVVEKRIKEVRFAFSLDALLHFLTEI
jgi:hypothetical protein